MNEIERLYVDELRSRFADIKGGTIADEKKKVDIIVALDKQYQEHLNREIKARNEEAERRIKEKEFELKKAQLEFDKKKFEVDKKLKESEISMNNRKISVEEAKELNDEQIKREEISLKREQLEIERTKLSMTKENAFNEHNLKKEELELRKDELDDKRRDINNSRLDRGFEIAEKVIGIIATTAATMIGIRTSKKLVEMGYAFEYADMGLKRSQTFKDISRNAMKFL